MRDYRVPKAIGGFNPQKLYTEILKSESTDIWKVQKLEDKTLIANGSALYIVPRSEERRVGKEWRSRRAPEH